MRVIYLAFFILLVQVSLVVSADQEQCEPGFSEERYVFTVTRKLLERGRALGKVSFTSCAANNRALYQADDTRFRIYPDGKVMVKRQLALHDGSVSFVLNAWDAKGLRHSVPIFVWNEKEQEMSGSSDSLLSTHVLNTAQGIPAKGLTITLSKLDGNQTRWVQVSRSVTNEDGRCPGLLRGEPLTTGTFQLRFDTKDYWKQMQQDSFYPYVEVVFTITDSKQKYHVPLLLSPFSYSTYRGS
ncbi:5-hydroxyisourate hydrolase-like [Leptodactylus fuscus]|uniref:5-hydroxyisourate hydrolase-like n=1 Tax=Leptodactylus fuscus TaxID=238119 RepID=UPI003F4F1A4C